MKGSWVDELFWTNKRMIITYITSARLFFSFQYQRWWLIELLGSNWITWLQNPFLIKPTIWYLAWAVLFDAIGDYTIWREAEAFVLSCRQQSAGPFFYWFSSLIEHLVFLFQWLVCINELNWPCLTVLLILLSALDLLPKKFEAHALALFAYRELNTIASSTFDIWIEEISLFFVLILNICATAKKS